MLDYSRWIWEGDKFVANLIASQLVAEQEATSLAEELRNSDPAHSTITDFCNFLVRKKVLSYWQCAMLRNGKTKGFFNGEYVLLDYLASNNTSSLYVAKHCQTGAVVVLVFEPPSPNYCEIRPAPACFSMPTQSNG